MEAYQTQIFRPARVLLLDYHQQRESVIRLCRDLNAYSKKLIFTFHRITDLTISESIYDQIIEYVQTIAKCLERITQEFVPSVYFGQFKSSISNATEEMIEAFTFMYFVMTNKLLRYEQMLSFIDAIITENDKRMVLERLWKIGQENTSSLIDDNRDNKMESCKLSQIKATQVEGSRSFVYFGDYFMGLFDLSGEIMRYTISNLVDEESKVLSKRSSTNLEFMETLYKQMRVLIDTYPNINVNQGILSNKFHVKGMSTMRKKMEVLKESLNKVEQIICETVIKSREDF